VENNSADVFFDDVAEKMKNDIQECLNNGFSFRILPFYAEVIMIF
jgi:hypothetical protein